jgi:hypothetical protein
MCTAIENPPPKDGMLSERRIIMVKNGEQLQNGNEIPSKTSPIRSFFETILNS